MNAQQLDHPDLYQRIAQQAAAQLNTLMQSLPGITAGVIATADGFEVSAKVAQGMDTAKLAAMACSISALGAMVGQESEIGACRDVLVEAALGSVLIIEIPHAQYPMILNLVTTHEEVLGQVLYRAKRVAESLAQVV